MGKRLSGIHGWAWAVCLGVLVGGASAAQEAGPVYIQGSEVNLRKGANTSAEVVQKVLIGTACQRQGEVDKKGWVQLRCGDAEGYTLDKLVGAEKPSLESLRAQAENTTKSTKERLDAAARAATLAPEDEPASRLLASLFFDVNFEQLDKDKRKGGLHEPFLVTCNENLEMQRLQLKSPPRSHEQCLTEELERTEYDWHQLSIREERFVSAMLQEGALVVYTGYLKPRAKGRLDPKDDEFDIVIESRSRSPIADALKTALQREARVPDSEARKYRGAYSEYKDMPALSPAAYKLFRSLPAVWYQLTERSDERFIQVNCGSIGGLVLGIDVYRRASIYRGSIPPEDESSLVYRIKDISKTPTGYLLQLCDERACYSSKTVTWPTAVPGVARWETQTDPDLDGKYDVLDEHFSVNKGRPNRVEYNSCSSGGE